MYGSAREKMGKGRKKESRMQQALPPMEDVYKRQMVPWKYSDFFITGMYLKKQGLRYPQQRKKPGPGKNFWMSARRLPLTIREEMRRILISIQRISNSSGFLLPAAPIW